jgi:non-heme chloroperoxidase
MPYLEQGDPNGVPLILVHAVGDSGRIFEGLLDNFPDSVHAFAPTLRGHGEASRPEAGYRSHDFAADLAAFMDELSIQVAVVAGGSSGGLVAQRFAIAYPDRLRGLVLLGSPLTLGDKPGAEELWHSTFSRLTDPVDPAFIRGFAESTLTRPMPDALMDAALQESLKVPAFVWRATVRGILDDDFSAELGRITAPTLVIWGDEDALLPREDQEALARGICGARLLVYQGAGHVFYWEDPGRAGADLALFVAELAA